MDTDKQTLLTQPRIRWSYFTDSEIRAILTDALLHGDRLLAIRAKSALARR